MRTTLSELFVGRARELDALRAALGEARTGRGRLALLSGDAGIGKTRLADALASEARAAGMRVVWGRCWDGGGAPAYWPWVQALRRLDEDPGAAAPRRDTTAAAAAITRLLAEPGAAPAAGAESEAARFALFDAIGPWLRHAAARQPLLLVFDDLHAADVPSLRLLERAAQELADAPLLLLGTYRSHQVATDPTRAGPLASLARQAVHLPLDGWDEAEVARVLGAAVGPAPALAAALHAATAGNPFYVIEIVRQIAAEPGRATLVPPTAMPIPTNVRQAIRGHLAGLSAPCRRTLAAAAVIGRAFDPALLDDLDADLEPPAETHLAAAAASGAIVASAGGHWTFRHDLIRATLCDDLPAAERARLHRCVGEALERRRDGQADIHLAEIAHHLRHGSASGCADAALAYTERAAREAAGRLAFEAAAALYEDALELVGQTRPADAAARADLLLALGEVQCRLASGLGRPAYERAAAASRAAGDAARLARAALGVADRGLGVPHRQPDAAAVALLEEALVALPAGDSPLRARLLARLAVELAVSDDRARGDAQSAAAVAMARRSGDRAALAHALSALYFVRWRWDAPEDRGAIAAEVVRLAAALGDVELEMQGESWLAIDLMRSGDARGLDALIVRYQPRAERLRHPRWLWMAANLRALRGLWRGDLAAAEAAIGAALATAARIDDPGARFNPLVQRFALRRAQGRLAEEEAAARLAAAHAADSPVPRTWLALLLCELGRADEARPLFEALAREDFADLRRERRLSVLPYLAEVCAALGDGRRAALLYELLQPHADVNLPYGVSLCFGSGAHYLGLLAATRGDAERAIAHFESALVRHERMDAPAWLAATRLALARTLRARRGLFRRTAGRWTVADGGAVLRLKHSKGLRYLAYLLRHPGRAHHVTELIALADGDTGPADAAPGAASFRRRLEDLRDTLEEATRFHDYQRAAAARSEIERLAEALGGGRAAAAAERARQNVARTIADAIRRIAAESPELGRYFATTVRTGAYCSFTPDPRLPIEWVV